MDADEVTYPLHIILRFEMEQALFADVNSVRNQSVLFLINLLFDLKIKRKQIFFLVFIRCNFNFN